jgi:tricorn protease-like protein
LRTSSKVPPRLTNIRTFEPGGIRAGGEVDGISNDGTTIAFYSTFKTRNLFATRIYTLEMQSGEIRELTTECFAQAPQYTPDGRSMIYMTGAEADIFPFQVQGADWWIMSKDGSDKRRLTFMNKAGHTQSVGQYRLAGTLSFIDDRSFYGDVMTQPLGLVGNIVKVTCLGTPDGGQP